MNVGGVASGIGFKGKGAARGMDVTSLRFQYLLQGGEGFLRPRRGSDSLAGPTSLLAPRASLWPDEKAWWPRKRISRRLCGPDARARDSFPERSTHWPQEKACISFPPRTRRSKRPVPAAKARQLGGADLFGGSETQSLRAVSYRALRATLAGHASAAASALSRSSTRESSAGFWSRDR